MNSHHEKTAVFLTLLQTEVYAGTSWIVSTLRGCYLKRCKVMRKEAITLETIIKYHLRWIYLSLVVSLFELEWQGQTVNTFDSLAEELWWLWATLTSCVTFEEVVLSVVFSAFDPKPLTQWPCISSTIFFFVAISVRSHPCLFIETFWRPYLTCILELSRIIVTIALSSPTSRGPAFWMKWRAL